MMAIDIPPSFEDGDIEELQKLTLRDLLIKVRTTRQDHPAEALIHFIKDRDIHSSYDGRPSLYEPGFLTDVRESIIPTGTIPRPESDAYNKDVLVAVSDNRVHTGGGFYAVSVMDADTMTVQCYKDNKLRWCHRVQQLAEKGSYRYGTIVFDEKEDWSHLRMMSNKKAFRANLVPINHINEMHITPEKIDMKALKNSSAAPTLIWADTFNSNLTPVGVLQSSHIGVTPNWDNISKHASEMKLLPPMINHSGQLADFTLDETGLEEAAARSRCIVSANHNTVQLITHDIMKILF